MIGANIKPHPLFPWAYCADGIKIAYSISTGGWYVEGTHHEGIPLPLATSVKQAIQMYRAEIAFLNSIRNGSLV